MKTKILITILLLSIVSWGQSTIFSENMGSPIATTSIAANVFQNSAPITFSGNADVRNTTPSTGYVDASASGNVFFTNTVGANFLISGINTSAFSSASLFMTLGHHKSSTAGNNELTIEVSSDGVIFSPLSYSRATGGGTAVWTLITPTGTIPSTTNLRIRFTQTSTITQFRIDDVKVISSSMSPTVTVSTTTLTNLNYISGTGPSAEQNFTVSGNNLTSNIVLTAPVNFEISLTSGSGFLSTINLVPSGGTVPVTVIFVRLKAGLVLNTYTGNITADSAGATQRTISLTGNVTASNASDLVTVAGSESVVISSLINDNAPLTSSVGIQVWRFKVRDGGATLNDIDNLPTILTAFTIAQQASNTVTIWSDAINTVALFDGAAFVATGVVTANQIQFTGLNVTVADNTEKTLSIRLSLKCPLGPGAKDNDRFVFSVNSSTNSTFSPSGSGKSAFTAAQSSTTQNVIGVISTMLVFSQQPVTTGVGSTMPNIVVTATDACGNKDFDFIGNVSLTSSGTMMGSPIIVGAIAGVAIFSNIVHTATGTGFNLTASSAGVLSAVSVLFNITAVTIFSEGDFAVVGINSNIASCIGGYSVGDDEISFITFKDIQSGDVFYITDNGYERTFSGLWGDTEGVYQITRNGSTITAGTVITFRFLNNSPYMEFTSPDSSWNFMKSPAFPSGTVNMNSGGDQIFFMQGGMWNNPAGANDATYTPGTLLYAFNTGSAWTPLANSSQHSALPLALRCFNMMPGTASDFIEYTGPTSPTSKFDWIIRLNNPVNWTNRLSCAGYTRIHVGNKYNVSPDSYVNGIWTGSKNTDWFDCGNWQTLKVPDVLTDVVIASPNATKDIIIDIVANSANAILYNNIAKCKDLTISRFKVQLEGNSNNKLEIHGNLQINNPFGILDMDDNNPATADGQLYLYGNWTNSNGTPEFYEGNGTVHFVGSAPQIINNVLPVGTEVFYNVVMNNNFDTAVSNDLIATGDLTINAGKSVSVATNGYIWVNKKLVHNGNLTIENSGQLIQVDETDTNTGAYNETTFKVKRIANVNKSDYVYWSSPTDGFDISGILSGPRYSWDTTYSNANGTQGNWVAASGSMFKGKGYIIAVPATSPERPAAPGILLTTFTGKPNNGQFNLSITRGNYNGIDYDADLSNPDNVLTTKYDDNWNLVGNPYPSAIDAEKFLILNQSKIEGAVWVWKHGLSPTSSTSPFYSNFTYNYSSSDYIKYNGLGSTDPDTFAGEIASGQGFMVNMLHSATTPGVLTFSNNLRSTDVDYKPYNNSDFFRGLSSDNNLVDQKHRIWLDIIDQTSGKLNRTLVGYTNNATLEKDYLYDCVHVPDSELNIYSLINKDPFIIQGRPLPFNDKDKISMGINVVNDGKYTIAIKKSDGVFQFNQDIFLEDKKLKIIHDLKQSPYVFTTSKGRIDNRFVLRFSKNTINQNIEPVSDNVIVVANQDGINIKSYVESLKDVYVFDILGRQLSGSTEIGKDEFRISKITNNQQLLILKITLINGMVVTKKIFY
jgi:hypothetical protein